MACNFKSTWTDNVAKINDLAPDECTVLQPQSDAGFFEQGEERSSVLMFLRSVREMIAMLVR